MLAVFVQVIIANICKNEVLEYRRVIFYELLGVLCSLFVYINRCKYLSIGCIVLLVVIFFLYTIVCNSFHYFTCDDNLGCDTV